MQGLISNHNQRNDQEVSSSDNSLEAIFYHQLRVEFVQEKIKVLGKCSQCDGVVVDLSSGMLHCGNLVPQAVLKNNQRILSS